MVSSSAPRSKHLAICFASTIFTSAFLLFQVQPLISKYILPWFGGSPTVWSTCMLFFQVVLFGGYVYAHLLTTYLNPRWQAALHCALVVTAAAMLPITPDASWKPDGAADPTWRIVSLLTCCVGLPYFILSSTGPLLQRWFSVQLPGASPYRLYALSNIGSLLALISYPFAFEPVLSSPAQADLWSWGFRTFAVLCGCCAIGLLKQPALADTITSTASEATTEEAPTWADRAMWVGLALVASLMLLATTNQVCLDVATVPFLWILPLTIYLLSFILCFDADRWYSRKWYVVLLALSLLGVIRTLLTGAAVSIVLQVMTYLSALYFCCMVCHGELAKQRPSPRYLTSFYLLISLGGAGGGLFVGVLAPAVFPAYWELHIGIVACLIATLAVFFRDKASVLYHGQSRPAWVGLLVWSGLLVHALQTHAREAVSSALAVTRNFYGVLRIVDEQPAGTAPAHRGMYHGSILHGVQFLEPEHKRNPTTYYGEQSGAGLALRFHRTNSPRHIGVVGLGVGTLATYGQKADRLRFYEINPDVITLAQQYFTYLSDSPAKSTMVLGDARLSLEQEPNNQFDVLVLDAFSGDAIPTHLLTHEAGQLYTRHLKPDGILCIHISNLHFDLRPVVLGLARDLGMQATCVEAPADESRGQLMCHWMLLTREALPPELLNDAHEVEGLPSKSIQWTDEWSNLLSVLR